MFGAFGQLPFGRDGGSLHTAPLATSHGGTYSMYSLPPGVARAGNGVITGAKKALTRC